MGRGVNRTGTKERTNGRERVELLEDFSEQGLTLGQEGMTRGRRGGGGRRGRCG